MSRFAGLEPDACRVQVEPCCFPFGDSAGPYYLQRQPMREGLEWKEEQQRAFRRRKVELEGRLRATRGRCSSMEEALQSLREAVKRREEQQEEGCAD